MGGNRRVEKGLFGINVGLNLMMMVRATIDIIGETSSLVPRHFFLLLQVPRRRDSLVIVLRRQIFRAALADELSTWVVHEAQGGGSLGVLEEPPFGHAVRLTGLIALGALIGDFLLLNVAL